MRGQETREKRVERELCQASHAEPKMRELEATEKKNLGEREMRLTLGLE